MWEVGGRGPGVEAAKPEVVPSLAKGAPEFQQAGTDTAQSVPTERFLPNRLPRVVREFRWSLKAAMRSYHAGQGCPWGLVI